MAESIRLLIVDDTPDDLEITLTQLRRALVSNPIETCASGEAALERLRDTTLPPIDVLVTDARLPRLSGEQAIAAIRSDPNLARVRTILLSAILPDARAKRKETGADGVLEKPLRIQDLLKALRRAGGFRVNILRD